MAKAGWDTHELGDESPPSLIQFIRPEMAVSEMLRDTVGIR
jgi:hypothetical protein